VIRKENQSMKTITVMCGLPRCGKSTWVKNNKKLEVVISADDLRYIVYNQRFWAEGEALMWSIRSIMLKYLMQQGIDIIIDETNTTKGRRMPILKMAKQYGYYVIGNVIEGYTPDMCKERAIREGQNDLIPIIDRMAEQFELPEKEEGFDELNMV
jgi:predicted kinase